MKKKAGNGITGFQLELSLFGDIPLYGLRAMSHKEPYASHVETSNVDSSGVVSPDFVGHLPERQKPQDVVVITGCFRPKRIPGRKKKKPTKPPLTQLFYFIGGKNVRVRCGVCDDGHP